MSQPRTYAELRHHWLQRVMPDIDLPHAWPETSRPIVQAIVDQLQRALRDSARDPEAGMATALALGMEPTTGRQDEVARTARTVRGPGSQYIEEAALQALVEIADEQAVPFLVECFRFSRPHDGTAGHRRSIVLRGIVTFAVLCRNAEALAILEEALDHKTVGVRLAACRAIADVAGMATVELPAPLVAHITLVARIDRAPAVRVSAAVALEAAERFPVLEE